MRAPLWLRCSQGCRFRWAVELDAQGFAFRWYQAGLREEADAYGFKLEPSRVPPSQAAPWAFCLAHRMPLAAKLIKAKRSRAACSADCEAATGENLRLLLRRRESWGGRMKRCRRCPKGPLWRCRSCGALCCEHLCGLKKMDGTATCGSCKRLSALLAPR